MIRRTFIGSVGLWSPGGAIAAVLLERTAGVDRSPVRDCDPTEHSVGVPLQLTGARTRPRDERPA